ncbi:MAG TPA: IS110 family transposase [Steroidobacteraceae bacterium]|nr:IS110 family transposase [Steroidobacteraceae bacterium]
MGLYCGIDLHSNNHVVTVIDDADRRVYERRLPNDLARTISALEPYRGELTAVAIESTFNWYWLADGLMEAGFTVRLVNTAAVQQYSGLKHTDDEYDAFWLAHLMRLGILPTGYIYPKAERGFRDLARQRIRLVQHRSALLLSAQNQVWRTTGVRLSAAMLRGESTAAWPVLSDPHVALSVDSARESIAALTVQIERLERILLAGVKSSAAHRLLMTVDGIGQILALTITLEVGEIGRFPGVGEFASYCRCVDSARLSNAKKKGEANRKNGNPYLAWAFMEAAVFATRYYPEAKRFYERKCRRRHPMLARKALAHKLARACYYILRDEVPFERQRLFAA